MSSSKLTSRAQGLDDGLQQPTSTAQSRPSIDRSSFDNYGRYSRYTVLIVCWGAIVIAYVVVLEAAVQNHSFMGAKGSSTRDLNFNILAFFRSGLSTIHVPLMIAVLASTVPCWTTIRSSQQSGKSDRLLPLAMLDSRFSLYRMCSNLHNTGIHNSFQPR